jgi:hypothetical protein
MELGNQSIEHNSLTHGVNAGSDTQRHVLFNLVNTNISINNAAIRAQTDVKRSITATTLSREPIMSPHFATAL